MVIVNFRCSTYFNIAFWTYLNDGGNEPINTVIRPVSTPSVRWKGLLSEL